jgi:ribosomal protein S18 acetylase RimI-like enzyme
VTAEDLARIRAFEKAIGARAAERAVPFAFGRAYFHDRLRRVWALNFVDLLEPSGVAEIAAEADRLQAGLEHRRVNVDDEELGRQLEGGFAERGWRTERLLVMAHRGRATGSKLEVQELSGPELETAWAEGVRGEPFGNDEDVVRQLVDHRHAVAAAVPTRYFAAIVDGRPVSYCELYAHGGTAQIESVATIEAHRGRGLARAVVLKALREARLAGNDLVFLVADADDWPQHLYRKLGFEAIGLNYRFLRTPAATERP